MAGELFKYLISVTTVSLCLWQDLLWAVSYYYRLHWMFAPLMGGFWGNFAFYFFVRYDQ